MEPSVLERELSRLKTDVREAATALGIEISNAGWKQALERKILPRFSPDFPLMVAVCGGGSSGKSTLFNSLVGKHVSPAGGRAGINRRVLVSAADSLRERNDLFRAIFEPFNAEPAPLTEIEEAKQPGQPLFVNNKQIPRNLVVMDTPDFDVGSKGAYVNREAVRQALEAADVLIYIFTNATYNNRGNTDFIREMLTGVGVRKCFLVYRTSAVFEDREVIDHAMTVARNLYGDKYESSVLGVYRTDEDNRVAAGETFMELRQARPADPAFDTALRRIEPLSIRPELISSILQDAIDQAEQFLEDARLSTDELRLYLDALKTAQSQYVLRALRHFPLQTVMKRFAEIWFSTDPSHVTWMRKVGDLLGMPVRTLMETVRWSRKRLTGKGKSVDPVADFKQRVEADLEDAARNLRLKAVGAEIALVVGRDDEIQRRMVELVSDIRGKRGITGAQPPYMETSGREGRQTVVVAAHPAVSDARSTLREMDWQGALSAILAEKDTIVRLSEEIDADLATLVTRFRAQMKLSAKLRQSFFAFLNIVPAVVAVPYVAITYDPAGGAGILAKLSGLFGINDLYALVAIPATTGMAKTDRRQMEKSILGPITDAWFKDKSKAVEEIFRRRITGEIISTGEARFARAEAALTAAAADITAVKRAISNSEAGLR